MVTLSDEAVRRDPVVAAVRALLAAQDPELLAAVEEVDRTLIVSGLARDPWQRVRESARNARYLSELRRCMTHPSRG